MSQSEEDPHIPERSATFRDERMMPLLYEELRALAAHHMRRERRGHTLQTTALVHEAYLKLSAENNAPASREHFLAMAAGTIRRILVDHARRHAARGGRMPRVALADVDPAAPRCETDFIALDVALEKLRELSERRSRIVELRFFGGMSVDETAQALDLSPRTVDAEWQAARTWLAEELEREATA